MCLRVHRMCMWVAEPPGRTSAGRRAISEGASESPKARWCTMCDRSTLLAAMECVLDLAVKWKFPGT